MEMQGIIWLSIASAAISYTVADALIILPFRKWIEKKSDFLGHLFCCGYCMSFWVSFILEGIFQPNLFGIPIIGHILTSFCIAFLSGLWWVAMVILIKIADK